jgi:PAS domain S-box-containing protein
VWNKNASDVTGFTSKDVMGRHLVNEFITEDHKERVQEVFRNALNGVETANFEFPLVTKTGTRVEVLLNATTRRDEANHVIGVVGIGQDITARIAQEQEYSKLIDTANAPIFGVDRDGLVNVWNKNASDVTGFSTDETMGKHLVNDFITEDYKERVQEVFTKALDGDETANFEFPLVTKAGTRVEVLLNATTRRDAEGRASGVVGIGQDITARIKKEQEYARLIDTANAPIFGIDLEGLVNVWNKNASDVTGFTTEDVMGRHLVNEFITEDHKERVQDVFTKALDGDETANFEFPIVTKAGTRVEVLLNATTRRDEANHVIGVVGIGQDITARMAQEQEYARLIDTANAPIFGVDVNGLVNVWNKNASDVTGFTSEDVMGRHLVNEFITDDYKESVQGVFTKALNGEETANFEFPLVTKPGTRVQVLLNATTRRDEQKHVVGVVGIGQDITARIAQEQEYARLIDTANAPIFGIDSNGLVNVWNGNASNLTGFSSEEVMGRHLVNEFITDDFKERVQNVFIKALAGVQTANFEFPLVTKAGVRVEVLLNATTRRDEHNRISGVVGIGQDITARIAQEQEYSRLIDTANAPIFGIDLEGLVNVWNKNASDVTGFTSKDVMGRHLVNEFITDDYKERVQAVFRNALNGVETANFEFPLVTKAGARLEVLLNATTRRDEANHVIGVVGIGQDITARIAQEQEYSKLIDTANAPIFGVDRDGLVNVWNRNASKLTGFAGEEVMGRNLVKDFITDDYKERVQGVFTKALVGRETANFEFPLVTKAGVSVRVLLNATTRRDDQGKATGVVGIGQDITARIAQEQEYARLIDTANAPIFGIDLEGRVNVWNQCASHLMGFETDDVMARARRPSVVKCFDDSLTPIAGRAPREPLHHGRL